jgi:hypothetical protein
MSVDRECSANPGKDSKAIDLSAAPSSTPDIEIFFAPLIVVNNGFTKTPGKSGLTIVRLDSFYLPFDRP